MLEKRSFLGCMVGQCLADALATRVADCTPAVCQNYVSGELTEWYTGEHRVPWMQYGECGQLARELFSSYVACREFNVADYAIRIRDFVVARRIVRRKLETHLAVKQLRLGRPWREAGTPTLDNGGAGRSAPMGLLFATRSAKRASAVRDQSRITHQSALCESGAVLVASAVSLAARGEIDAPKTFLQCLVAESPEIDGAFVEALSRLEDWLQLSPERAHALIMQTGSLDKAAYPYAGLSPHVVPTVLLALYCFLTANQNYWDRVCHALITGGDVPTVTGIVGAISGAREGLEAIPQHLAHQITDRGINGYQDLIDIAGQAFEIAVPNSAGQD